MIEEGEALHPLLRLQDAETESQDATPALVLEIGVPIATIGRAKIDPGQEIVSRMAAATELEVFTNGPRMATKSSSKKISKANQIITKAAQILARSSWTTGDFNEKKYPSEEQPKFGPSPLLIP